MNYKEYTSKRGAFYCFAAALISLFFYTLNPKIALPFGGSLSSAVFSVLIIGFVFVMMKRFYSLITPNKLLVISLLLLIGLYASIAELVVGITHSDFVFFRIIIHNIVYLIFSYMATVVFLHMKFDIYDAFKMFFYISGINAILVLVSFAFPSFRAFLESILFQDVRSNINYVISPMSLRGMAAAGGAGLSVFMGTGVLSGVMALERKKISDWLFCIFSILIMFSLMVVGRTGLIFALIILGMWFFWQLRSLNAKRIALICGLLACGCFLLFFNLSRFEVVLSYAFEIFINLFRGKGLVSASSEDLFRMLKTPSFSRWWNIFFGFGFFEVDQSFRSDSGYFKTFFSLGLPLTIILYLSLAYILIIKVTNSFSDGKLYWVLGMLIYFAMEIKEPFIYQNFSGRFLVFITVFAIVESNVKSNGHIERKNLNSFDS